jgi:hypothetical protein
MEAEAAREREKALAQYGLERVIELKAIALTRLRDLIKPPAEKRRKNKAADEAVAAALPPSKRKPKLVVTKSSGRISVLTAS